MNTVVLLSIFILFFVLISATSSADTKIMEQSTSYCQSGEQVIGGVNLGEKVEVRIRVLIDEEKELSLFTEMKYPVFYLEEDKISENNSLMLFLAPGTHTIRVVGTIPSGAEGQDITLLGCDNLGRYITSNIISPYILKEAANKYVILSGIVCSIVSGIVVFTVTKGKLYRMKASVEKKNGEDSRIIRKKLKRYLEKIAPNLTSEQRKEAKSLMIELGDILKWK